MTFPPVLWVVMSLCISFSVGVADASVGERGFARRHDVPGVALNVDGGKVRSLLDCGALCRSSSCKVFCYNPTSALCRLSQPADPSVQNYNVSGSKCYHPIRCPASAGYAWHGLRCIKLYTVLQDHGQARATCSRDGGHLYDIKTPEWDLPLIADLKASHAVNTFNVLWVGADDMAVGGQFRWSDSSLLANDSVLWAPGEPDSAYQHCVMLYAQSYTLHTLSCQHKLKFLCQIDV